VWSWILCVVYEDLSNWKCWMWWLRMVTNRNQQLKADSIRVLSLFRCETNRLIIPDTNGWWNHHNPDKPEFISLFVFVCVFVCVWARALKLDPHYLLPPRTQNVALNPNAELQNAHVFAFVKLLRRFLVQCRLLIGTIGTIKSPIHIGFY